MITRKNAPHFPGGMSYTLRLARVDGNGGVTWRE
jgi:hypothetical protein